MVKVRYTQRHLNLSHQQTAALERLDYAVRCFNAMQEMRTIRSNRNLRALPDSDLTLQAMWHDAVNTAVSVYDLVGFDAEISGVFGLPDDLAQKFAQEKGWDDNPDFREWRAMRHHNSHVLRRETSSFPMRQTLPVVNPSERHRITKWYIADDNFDELPDKDATKRFEQFVEGLFAAVRDWYGDKVAEANKEATQWFSRAAVKKRKADHKPFMVFDTAGPDEAAIRGHMERLLMDLRRDIQSAQCTSHKVAAYKHELRRALRAFGIHETRFKVERLNIAPSESEMERSQWARHIEAQLEALNYWVKDGGGQ